MSISIRRCLFVALLAGLPAAGNAVSAMQPANEGAWAGMAGSDTGRTMHVVAGFENGAVSLRFGEPAACNIAASALHVDGGTQTYRFKVSQNGGPFCRKLYPGELTFTTLPTGSIGLRFARGDATWSGTLERVGYP